MTVVLQTKLPHEGRIYSLVVEVDDEAYAHGGELAFKVRGSVTEEGRPPREVSAGVALTRDENNELHLTLTANDTEVLRLPLADLIESDTLAGRIIEALPVQFVDPFLACLVRSGISAAIDQIAACWEQRPREADRLTVASAVLECLYSNRLRVGARTLMRTGRCAMGLF